MTHALLLAAGSQEKWGNAYGVPKHMIHIAGEPLIHRTQRQLREHGVTDITVIAQLEHHEMFVLPTSNAAIPAPSQRSWIQEWDGSRHLWRSGKTIVIYGDCYLTDSLVEALVADPGDPWRVYARFTPSYLTGKRYGEMFAWVFTDEAWPILDEARAEAIALVDSGQWWRALGWEVYRAAVGLPIKTYRGRELVHSVHWYDVSDDFDTPDEWESWAFLNPDLT